MIPNLDLILNLRGQINDNPEDYPLRLVYADLLEETGIQGYVREAECIRSPVWQRVWNPDYSSEDVLLAGRCGMLDLNTDGGNGIHHRIFTLIDFMAMPMKLWLDNGPRLIRNYPIQRVRITDVIPVEGNVYLPRNTPWSSGITGTWNYHSANSTFVPMWVLWRLSHNIPNEIWNILVNQPDYDHLVFQNEWIDPPQDPDIPVVHYDVVEQIRYLSIKAARLALSDACIQWAKAQNENKP